MQDFDHSEEDRKTAVQYLKRSDRTQRNTIRINATNTRGHELVKGLLAKNIRVIGKEFVTEAQMQHPLSGQRLGRADILNLDDAHIEEIVVNETEAKSLEKAKKYPLEINQTHVEQVFQKIEIPGSKEFYINVWWKIPLTKDGQAVELLSPCVSEEPPTLPIPLSPYSPLQSDRKPMREKKRRDINYSRSLKYIPYQDRKPHNAIFPIHHK